MAPSKFSSVLRLCPKDFFLLFLPAAAVITLMGPATAPASSGILTLLPGRSGNHCHIIAKSHAGGTREIGQMAEKVRCPLAAKSEVVRARQTGPVGIDVRFRLARAGLLSR